MNADVASQVLDIVAKQSGKDRSVVTPEATLKDLEVDSLEAIETVFEIEEAFKIQLADDQNRDGSETLKSLIEAVQAAIDRRDHEAGTAHAA
ncbi:acyl carrier protein [Luteibacter sp.]|uniref:acyl carrier protein n=1 Tax=Luteibacter sp. TaxID=1886636 RepID=UPI003F801A53